MTGLLPPPHPIAETVTVKSKQYRTKKACLCGIDLVNATTRPIRIITIVSSHVREVMLGERGSFIRPTAVDCVGAVILRIEPVWFEPGVTEADEREQEGIGAGPAMEQESAIGLLNESVAPTSGMIVMFVLTAPPRATVKLDASADKKKFGPLSNAAVTF
jgi:hypothetical protein